MNDDRTTIGDLFTDPTDFVELLDEAEERASKSDDIDFVAETKERYDTYLTRAYLSSRQLEKLERIAGRNHGPR
jgi:hypothetical protein